MRSLRAKLQSLTKHPAAQRALLVGRPNSVMALAHLACREGEAPIVRYLVLRELCGVVHAWADLLDADLVSRANEMAADARKRTRSQLIAELGSNRRRADEMLDWFEDRLVKFDRTTS